jgi:propionyl-CoA synthetase
MKQADYVHWHKRPEKALEVTKKTLSDGSSHPKWSWFPGGEVSTCYNCLDRHIIAGQGETTATIWESPVTGEKERFT